MKFRLPALMASGGEIDVSKFNFCERILILVGGPTSKKLHFVRKAPNLAWTFIWTI
jgi:hypothetical protein